MLRGNQTRPHPRESLGPETWRSTVESQVGAVGGHDDLDLNGARAGGGGLHQVARKKGHSRVGRWGPPEQEFGKTTHWVPEAMTDTLVITCAFSANMLHRKLDPRLQGGTGRRKPGPVQALRLPLRSQVAGARTWEE